MKWEEFNPWDAYKETARWKETDIECPKCGAKIFRDMAMVLTSYPPKHNYWCKECDWRGVK